MSCRACGAVIEPVVDLATQPTASGFPRPSDAPGDTAPLRLGVCRSCGLAQLADPSPVETDDPDAPSPLTSATMAGHARGFVDDLMARGLASSAVRIMSLASHGGHLEPFLRERGASATIVNDTQSLLAVPPGAFDLIVDNYRLAHLEHPREALARLRALLAPGGCLVLEFDALLATVEGCQWDAIGHGHPVYLSLRWLKSELEAVGLEIVDAVVQPVYGGAVRVFAFADRSPGPAVEALIAREASAGIGTPAGLAPLAAAVDRSRREVVPHLQAARAAGRRVAGYGAPARAITFLNALRIGPELLPFTVDQSPAKHGRVIPGVEIPVRGVDALTSDPPGEILLLTWNLIDEVRSALRPMLDAGTRLLVAIPNLRDVTEPPADFDGPGQLDRASGEGAVR
jgi:hypothetical protein